MAKLVISAAKSQQKTVANLDGNEIKVIPVNKIEEREDNDYLNGYDEDVIASISENNIDALDNIIVEPIILDGKASGRYRIVSGHQRFRAENKLKRKTVTCKVVTFKEEYGSLEAAILANVHRKDDPIHLARRIEAYEKDVYPHKVKNDSTIVNKKKYIAKVFGLSETKYVRIGVLLKLDDSIQKLVEDGYMSYVFANRLNRFTLEQQKQFGKMANEYIQEQIKREPSKTENIISEQKTDEFMAIIEADGSSEPEKQRKVVSLNKVVERHKKALDKELKRDIGSMSDEEKNASIEALLSLKEMVDKALRMLK